MNTYKMAMESLVGTLKRSEVEGKLVEASWSHMLYVDSATGAFKFTKLKKANGEWNLNKPVKYDPNMVSIRMGNDSFKFIAVNFNSAVTMEGLVNFSQTVFGEVCALERNKKGWFTRATLGDKTIATYCDGKWNFMISSWSSLMLGQVIEAACKASSVDPGMLLPSAPSWLFDKDGNGKIVQVRFRYSTNGNPWTGGKDSFQRAGQDTCGKLYESYKKVRLAVIDEKELTCKSGDGHIVVRPNIEWGWTEGSYDLVRGYFVVEDKTYSIVKGRRVVSNNAANLTSIGAVSLKNDTLGSYDGITSSANLKGVSYSDLPVDWRGNAYVDAFIACSKDEDKEKKSMGNRIGFTALSILDLDAASQNWILDKLALNLKKIAKKIENPSSSININLEADIEDGRILNSTFSKIALGIASGSEEAMLMEKLIDEAKSIRSKDLFYVKVIFATHWNGRELSFNEVVPSEQVEDKFVTVKEDSNRSSMVMRLPLASPQSAQQIEMSLETNGLKGMIVVMHPAGAAAMSGDSDDSLVVAANLVSLHIPGEVPMITARAPKPEQIRSVKDVSLGELVILGEYNRMQTGIYANELFKLTSLIRESNLSESAKKLGIAFVCQELGQNMELTIQGAKKPVAPEAIQIVRDRILERLVRYGLAFTDKYGNLRMCGTYNYGFIQTYKFSFETMPALNKAFSDLFGMGLPVFEEVAPQDLCAAMYANDLLLSVVEDAKLVSNSALAKIWAAKALRATIVSVFEVEFNKEFCTTLDKFTAEEWTAIGGKVTEALTTYAQIATLVADNAYCMQALAGGALWMNVTLNGYEVVEEELAA